MIDRPEATGQVELRRHHRLAAPADAVLERQADEACRRICEELRAGGSPSAEAVERSGAFAARAGSECFGVRDPLGTVPFYYSEEGGTLKTGERLAELVGEGEPVLDEREVARFLIGRGVRREATLAAHVRKLPAGHWLHAAGAGRVRIARYWRPEEVAPREISLATAAAELRSLVAAAIERELGPAVGVHLSGGLDSAAMAAMVRRAVAAGGGGRVTGYVWQPPRGDDVVAADEDSDREYRLIEAVAKHCDITPEFAPPTMEEVLTTLRLDPVRHETAMLLNEWSVLRRARAAGVTTIFSGWGGDQFCSCAAVGLHAELLARGQWRELGRRLRASERGWAWETASMVRTLVCSPGRGTERPALEETFIDRDFLRHRELDLPPKLPWWGSRRRQLAVLEHGSLQERMEGWAEAGGRHGVRYVYPLLDRRVIECVLSLPPTIFSEGGEHRRLLRHMLGDDLPPALRGPLSKLEPVRLGGLLRALRGALAELGAELRQRRTLPTRGRFVDLPRLAQALEPAALAARRTGWAKLAAAVQFLNL